MESHNQNHIWGGFENYPESNIMY